MRFCILESSFLSERILRNSVVRRLLVQLVLFVQVLGTLQKLYCLTYLSLLTCNYLSEPQASGICRGRQADIKRNVREYLEFYKIIIKYTIMKRFMKYDLIFKNWTNKMHTHSQFNVSIHKTPACFESQCPVIRECCCTKQSPVHTTVSNVHNCSEIINV